MTKITEGQVWVQKLQRWGGSYAFIVDKDAREFLGLEKNKDGDIEIEVKADKGKHGRFLAFFKGVLGKPKK